MHAILCGWPCPQEGKYTAGHEFFSRNAHVCCKHAAAVNGYGAQRCTRHRNLWSVWCMSGCAGIHVRRLEATLCSILLVPKLEHSIALRCVWKEACGTEFRFRLVAGFLLPVLIRSFGMHPSESCCYFGGPVYSGEGDLGFPLVFPAPPPPFPLWVLWWVLSPVLCVVLCFFCWCYLPCLRVFEGFKRLTDGLGGLCDDFRTFQSAVWRV